MSDLLFQYARDAKGFIQQSGEDMISDELIMRAVVAYHMLERRGMLAPDGVGSDARDAGLFDETERRLARAHAIAIIAHNFDRVLDDTPQRRHLFAHEIGDPMGDAMREAVAGNRRAIGLD